MNIYHSNEARGLSCRIRGDMRQSALADLYCMNCDPNQPRVS